MREYRFRAWDGINKKMYSPEALEQEDVPEDVNKSIYSYLSYGVLCIYDFAGGGEPIELMPMQYIGFHDKNMKDIFEGDLLEIEEVIYQVVWSTEIAGYLVISERRDSMIAGEGLPDAAVIVGNIYENPEWMIEAQ